MHRLQQMIFITIILNILLPYWIQTHTKLNKETLTDEEYFQAKALNNASLRLVLETMPVMAPLANKLSRENYEPLTDDYLIAKLVNQSQIVVHLSALPILSTRFRETLYSKRAPRLLIAIPQ